MSTHTRYLIGGLYAMACCAGVLSSLLAALWWLYDDKPIPFWMAFTAGHLFCFASCILTSEK